MKREYLTLATGVDSILPGSILRGLDIAVQRLKSVEQINQCIPANMANRWELIPPEGAALASAEESRAAAHEQKREDQVMSHDILQRERKMGMDEVATTVGRSGDQRRQTEETPERRKESEDRGNGVLSKGFQLK